jgi:TRAP-type C4-dicarboxylate transport system permease small subunit
MRKTLDVLYDSAAALAALFLVGLLAMVLLSITGRQLNFHVPCTDAYAGYLMAASGFLALAHTLKRGEHIRVTLMLGAVKGRLKKILTLWGLGFSTLLATMIAFYSCKLAWQSHTFHDISTASDATPLWLPQIGMALGTLILAIAFIDEFWLELSGQGAQSSRNELVRNE